MFFFQLFFTCYGIHYSIVICCEYCTDCKRSLPCSCLLNSTTLKFDWGKRWQTWFIPARAKYCEGVVEIGVDGVGFGKVGSRRSNFGWVEDGDGSGIQHEGGDEVGNCGVERSSIALDLPVWPTSEVAHIVEIRLSGIYIYDYPCRSVIFCDLNKIIINIIRPLLQFNESYQM